MNAAVRIITSLFVAQSVLAVDVRGQVFGIVSDTSELYKISEIDGTVELVGDAGDVFLAGLDFRPADGFLYGFNAFNLVRIDHRDATAVVVGPHGLSSLVEGGLAIFPTDLAYGLGKTSSSSLGPDLFSIDLNPGQGTVVANLGNQVYDVNGLAWRSDNKLVGIDRARNALLEIDAVTGENKVVSVLNPSLGGIGGLAGNGWRGFFTTSPILLGGTNEIYSIDFFTGEHSLVGNLGPTIASSGISGLAFVPEPGALELTITVLFAGLLGSRRHLKPQ